MSVRTSFVALVFVVVIIASRAAPAAELFGEVAFESRLFPNDALDVPQQDAGLSVAVEPEFYHDWADGAERLSSSPLGAGT